MNDNNHSMLLTEALDFFHSLEDRLGPPQTFTTKGSPFIEPAVVVTRKLTETDSLQAASYMHQLGLAGENDNALSLWALAQRCPDVLFSIHPYIEKLMFALACHVDNGGLDANGDYSVEGLRKTFCTDSPVGRKAINSYINDEGQIIVELEPESEKP